MEDKCLSGDHIETIQDKDSSKKCVFCACTHCILGEGGFGAVFKGKLYEGQQESAIPSAEVAVKRLTRGKGGSTEDHIKEAELMFAVDGHENILKFHFYTHKGDMV